MSFLNFLEQMVTGINPDATDTPANDPNQIVVTGGKQDVGGPQPPLMGNSNYLQEAQAAMADAPEHKGMFGMKGTLRDVLGTLGDAFLVQSGNKRIYAPARDQERMSDAMGGFTADPLGAMERLSQVNPAAAQELYKQYAQQQYQKGQLASLNANRQSLIDQRNFDAGDKGIERVSQWVYGGLPYNQVVAGASRYGLSEKDLNELGITPDMTDEDRKAFAYGAMSVNQQVQVPFTERRVKTGEKNADTAAYNAQTGRINANRPRSERSQTDLEYYKELSNKPENERTPEEKAFMKKFTNTGRGSRLSGIAPPPPPKGSSASRFRIIP